MESRGSFGEAKWSKMEPITIPNRSGTTASGSSTGAERGRSTELNGAADARATVAPPASIKKK